MTEGTERLYLEDAYLRRFTARVVAVDGDRVAVDRSAFYPTGGGQPHDTGRLGSCEVVDVRKEGEVVWHTVSGTPPAVGEEVEGELDWDRRHRLMRTHTALHILNGVIWHEWSTPCTGGSSMEPLSARMDFEFDPLPAGFAETVERRTNEEVTAARPIRVRFAPREAALRDEDLIRTKTVLVPDSVETIRIVEIVGLDSQADGGTHVRSTDEVGRVRVVKTESKGKAFKRVRIEVLDV
jgi:misacylated tRNA(Ala) deacylase